MIQGTGHFQLRKFSNATCSNTLIARSDEQHAFHGPFEKSHENDKAVICPNLDRFTVFQNMKVNEFLFLISSKGECLGETRDKDFYLYVDWNVLSQVEKVYIVISDSKDKALRRVTK
jgi:hypothetical protein